MDLLRPQQETQPWTLAQQDHCDERRDGRQRACDDRRTGRCTATRSTAIPSGPAIAHIEPMTGIEVRRGHVDKGYRGHNYPLKFRVWISGQVRRPTAAIKREMKRRAAIEPMIGHLKAEHRLDRNYLKWREASPRRPGRSTLARPLAE